MRSEDVRVARVNGAKGARDPGEGEEEGGGADGVRRAFGDEGDERKKGFDVCFSVETVTFVFVFF